MYDLFSQPQPAFTAPQLADVGMRMAEDHANEVVPSWSEKCFQLFKEFLKKTDTSFLGEHFRTYCETGNRLETPPSKRAYGAIMKRASKEGLIRQTGFAKTSNPKAHCAPTAVWVAVR